MYPPQSQYSEGGYYQNYNQPQRGYANVPPEYEDRNKLQSDPSMMNPPINNFAQMSLDQPNVHQSHCTTSPEIQENRLPTQALYSPYTPSSVPQNKEPPHYNQSYQSVTQSPQNYNIAYGNDIQHYPASGMPANSQQQQNASMQQHNLPTPPLPPMPPLNNQSNYPTQIMSHMGHLQPQYATGPTMPQVDRPGKYPSAQTQFINGAGNSVVHGPTHSTLQTLPNLPDVVKLIEDDRSRNFGCFDTHETVKGHLPPLASTDFICRDDGNCNPRFVRSSLYIVPTTAELVKSLNLPFTLTISPFANLHQDDQPVMISPCDEHGPVRCSRCKAYVSPFVGFVDGGQRFQCPLCDVRTRVPEYYFAHLDQAGRRVDTLYRPELCHGSYELQATVDYCKNETLPQAPAFIFILDVSQASLSSGLVSLFCSNFVEYILPSLPREDYEVEGSQTAVKLGFITYDHQIHFYTFGYGPSGLQDGTMQHNGQPTAHNASHLPKMHVVADVGDVFVPAIEGFLISPDPTATANILDLIPRQCSANNSQGCGTKDAVLGSAIQAGLEALSAANRPGKLFVLHSNLPTAEAPGKLTFRNDPRLIGTDKEKSLLQPAGDFYSELGRKCVNAGCSVDLFLFPSSYVDLATLAEVPRLTAGHIYKYNVFQADIQGNQFLSDLAFAFSRSKAFDAVFRVRTSPGIRPFKFYGNYNLQFTSDVELAAVDSKTAVTVEIRHDDKLQENDHVYVQVACLFTSLSGQRRIRVHNLSLPVSSCPKNIFMGVELDAHLNFLSKSALNDLYSRAHSHVVDELTEKMAQTLAFYRRNINTQPMHAGGASTKEIVFPTSMALFPLYVLCLMKTEAFAQSGKSSIDDKSLAIFRFNSMDVKESARYLYPRMYPVHSLGPNFEGQVVYPPLVRCSYEQLSPEGAYILENGIQLFLWLGANLSDDWVHSVLGVPSLSNLESERFYELPRLDNDTSKALCSLMDRIFQDHGQSMRLLIIRQGDSREPHFKRFMTEDGFDNSWVSYSKYIMHIHKEVNALLR